MNWVKEDNAMVYEEARVYVLKTTIAMLALSLALISMRLTGWWT